MYRKVLKDKNSIQIFQNLTVKRVSLNCSVFAFHYPYGSATEHAVAEESHLPVAGLGGSSASA